jgi:hypothetical protein
MGERIQACARILLERLLLPTALVLGLLIVQGNQAHFKDVRQ